MVIKNPWIGYLDRSYSQIKTSILTRLRTNAPEVTDFSESNILVIIIGIFAGIAEMLNYYIDNMAREAFLSTARKWESIIKITQLINYRIKASISASVDLTFTAIGSTGEGVVVLTPISIPMGTVVTNSSGVNFLTTRVGFIGLGLYNVRIPARQQALVAKYTIGSSNGTSGQIFALPASYDDGTIYVEVASITWDYKEHLGFSSPTSTHYTIERLIDGVYYITFGDNINGKVPDSGSVIAVAYRTTLGIRGNLPENTLTTLVSTLTIPIQPRAISSITVTNTSRSVGGLPVEDIERVRKSAPLSLRTLDRAVTRQDFQDITKLSPSVDKAGVLFNCGKQVNLYVSPIGGGVASTAILASTEAYVETRKIIGLKIKAIAAGETYIGLNVIATAKFRVNTNLVITDIQKALVDKYSSDNSDINLPIRTSDIIALIDNLEKVDYLDPVDIYAVPYARPINNDLQLNWERSPGPSAIGSTPTYWGLVYSSGSFKLLKGDVIAATLTVGVPHTQDGIITLTINAVPAGVVDGHRWKFTVYPINQDIILEDYTMPRIHPEFKYVSLTVNEQV